MFQHRCKRKWCCGPQRHRAENLRERTNPHRQRRRRFSSRRILFWRTRFDRDPSIRRYQSMTKARTSGRGFRSNRRPALLPRSIAPVPPVEIAPENRGPTWLAGQWRAGPDVLSAEAYAIDTNAKLELFLLFLSGGATPIGIFRRRHEKDLDTALKSST